MSRITTAKPRRSPTSSRNAEMPKCVQNRDPSLRRREALAFASPLRLSHREIGLGIATLDRRDGIQGQGVSSQDLLRPVARETFRPRASAHEVAVGIQHEDRVVLEDLDQQEEALPAQG